MWILLLALTTWYGDSKWNIVCMCVRVHDEKERTSLTEIVTSKAHFPDLTHKPKELEIYNFGNSLASTSEEI